jgi:hypothetical protein
VRLAQRWAIGIHGLMLGCSAGNDVDPNGPEVLGQAIASYCAADCSRYDACVSPGSASSCTSYCRGQLFFAQLAPAALTLVANCLRRAPCATIIDDSAYEVCFGEAAELVEPSAQCEQYCVEDATTAFECGGGYSIDSCLSSGVCSWSDTVLLRATSCERLECAEREPCLEATFGGGG